jgi:hypothetical protein
MANMKPGMVSEILFYHKDKKLIIKIIPGGYHRNKSQVEKLYGWQIAKTFGEAWDRIFGPKPEKPKVQSLGFGISGKVTGVDLAKTQDQTVKTTFQSTQKGPILISQEVVPTGTETPIKIGEHHGQGSQVC